jgi:hypothetical protein
MGSTIAEVASSITSRIGVRELFSRNTQAPNEQALYYMLQEVYKKPSLIPLVGSEEFQKQLPESLKAQLNETFEKIETVIQNKDLNTNIDFGTGYCALVFTVDNEANVRFDIKTFENLEDLVEFKQCQNSCLAKVLYAKFGEDALAELQGTPCDIEEIRSEITSLAKQDLHSKAQKMATDIMDRTISMAKVPNAMVFEVAKALATQNGFMAALFVLTTSQKLTLQERYQVALIASKTQADTTLKYLENYMLTEMQESALREKCGG